MPRVRRVRGEALLALALLNIFVLVAGLVTLDVIEARPVPAEPAPVTDAEGVAAVEPVTSAPADPGRIADILDDPMSDSGLEEGLSGYVVDAATGETLFELAPDTPVTPASTTKIVTAVTVLTAVGPDHVLHTEVYLDPDRNRVVLRGAGDVTLTERADSAAYPQVATLEELAGSTAAALAELGLDTVSVGYDDSYFTGSVLGPGWKPNYVTEQSTSPAHALMLDSGWVDENANGVIDDTEHRAYDPPLYAAESFVRQLERAGVSVEGDPTETEATGAVVASVASAPVSALVEHMLLASDNNMAEALGRVAAEAMGEETSFAGAAAATHRVMADLGVEGVELSDNSGLSTQNRISPRALVELLRIASDPANPELNATLTGLPTANSTGTLGSHGRYGEYAPTHDAAGLVRGKTGTLNGVSTLAGTVRDQDGHTFYFAFMANDPGARGALLDTFAAALARCGCS
ncbi:D-alanyl-D-alanine carboxypeptidase/D-alanyl-D-alanine-endopeptidase [Nocardiopsis sp. FIRDI 009]|uniref:D-alanyl-D-alanine carboxypeptidase/D-alanyl-D-alanine endopeptidase n=1 Tax=Nocardiopsis sp. FIRDI 009 TaxID=714197 RepID=UPI000E25E124|nr:D-alanyl-D-alanine carboxypeptidase/D-alanyl-D-alanine-endopeptidase [Nocardiopsis sp. FIRDI 009]